MNDYLIFLVVVDISLGIIKWCWESSMGHTPVTSIEVDFLFQRYGDKLIKEIKKILEDDNKERRIQRFNEYLRIRDATRGRVDVPKRTDDASSRNEEI